MFGLDNVSDISIAVFIGTLLVFVTLALAGAGDRGRRKLDRRIDRVGAARGRAARADAAAGQATVRRGMGGRGVERWLTRVLPNRGALQLRLEQTGVGIALWHYVFASVGLAVVVMLVCRFILDLPALLSFLPGLLLGYIVPRFVVGYLARKRLKKFLALFPDARDLMVRTVKSGLPITEAIELAAHDMPEPIRTEFRRVSDQMRVGRQLEEALWDMADRLNLPEVQFFVVSLSVQRETGGNIGETLSNLSTLLRRRQQMKLKIKALSAEARASAWIVGALPFAMTAVLFIVNKPYIIQLFEDPRGHILIGAGLALQLIGIAWMMKMSRFEV
jgi:tight adherence protein B